MRENPKHGGQTFEFAALDEPLKPNILLAFRRNAGWERTAEPKNFRPVDARSRVQWATVRVGMKLIGIARLELAPPQFCYLSDFIILDAYRGRGVGEWLMHRIENHCLQRGIPRLLLQATATSRGFYDKLKFSTDPLVDGFLRKELLPLHCRPLLV